MTDAQPQGRSRRRVLPGDARGSVELFDEVDGFLARFRGWSTSSCRGSRRMVGEQLERM